MTNFNISQRTGIEPPIFTTSIPTEEDKTKASDASSLFNESVPASPQIVKRKLAKTLPLNKEEIGQKIEMTLQQLKQVKQEFNVIQDKAEKTSLSYMITTIVQRWVSDIVLKGGALVAQSGLPFIVHSSETLSTLNPITECIKFATDIIDTSSGLVSYIYQCRILQAAKEELKHIRTGYNHLLPEQQKRLRQLEGLIQYEESLLPLKGVEQGVRIFRNAFSLSTFALSWVKNGSLVVSLTAGANALIGGFNAALYGILFYRAHQDLKIHRSWSKEFKNWIKEHTLSITLDPAQKEEASKNIQKTMQEVIDTRRERQESQIESLKKKIGSNRITMKSIHTHIEKFRSQGLQSFLLNLNVKTMKETEFAERLQEKVGIPLNPEVVEAMRTSCLRLQEIKDSISLSSSEKQEELEHTHAILARDIKECIQTWISQQKEESLLAQYIDYQSVLDSTIKASLTAMVKKKHKIEKGFLKLKHIDFGTRFSAASVVFGAALALAIIGLVTTPFGGAGLILLVLGVASVGIGIGLTIAGYYYAHKQKPVLTAATLKGAYFRLYYYQAMAQILSAKKSIGEYLAHSYRDKTDRITAMIGQTSLFQRFSSPKDPAATPSPAVQQKSQEEQNKIQIWQDKAKKLQEELEQMAWADFAKQADLKVSPQLDAFDTLEALNEALNQSDFNLLSDETKELLEMQLGINIHFLQAEIKKDPVAVKKLLRKFFNLDTVDFVKLVGQQAHLKKLSP